MMTEQPDDDLYDEAPPDDFPEQSEVLHFDAPRAESDTERGLTRFDIGDDPTVLLARRPKAAIMMRLLRLSKSTDEMERVSIIDEFMDAALVADSRDYLRDRFEDPDDTWDYDVLVPVIEALKARWFPGRTPGKSTASGRTQSRSGTRSTVRARSRG